MNRLGPSIGPSEKLGPKTSSLGDQNRRLGPGHTQYLSPAVLGKILSGGKNVTCIEFKICKFCVESKRQNWGMRMGLKFENFAALTA